MKKILTLIVFLSLSVFSAMAEEQSYTDDLYVTINDETVGPMTSTITVELQEDGNYTLSLKNFILMADEDPMPVGNVTVADVPVASETSAYKILVKEADIMLLDGDDPDVPLWMGPLICEGVGAIPVKVEAKMSDAKLFAKIDIDLSEALGQLIHVTFGSDSFKSEGIEGVQETGRGVQGYYNLAGQRLSQPCKGINIVAGKKVIR